MGAKKAGSLFPIERTPAASVQGPTSEPLPLAPVAALGPRPNAAAAPEAIDFSALKPIPRPPPAPLAETPTGEDPPLRRRGKRRRSGRQKGSRLWILLVFAGAAIMAALLAILLHH